MILDKLQQFDAAASLASTIVGAGVDSASTLDLLNARDLAIGDGLNLEVVFTVTTSFAASGGAASLTLKIRSSADNNSFNTLLISDNIPKANLTAGTVLRFPLPSQAANSQASLMRYLKCNYVAVTNDFTSGAFECDLVVNPQASNPPAYAAGITVAN